MGAWGVGSFENDDALDWVWALADDDDGSVLGAAFAPVTNAGESDYVEAPEAANAIAAAEVVAASIAGDASRLPEEAQVWVTAHASVVGPKLVDAASRSVERVRERSELQELWDEAGAEEWLSSVNDLASRLTSVQS